MNFYSTARASFIACPRCLRPVYPRACNGGTGCVAAHATATAPHSDYRCSCGLAWYST